MAQPKPKLELVRPTRSPEALASLVRPAAGPTPLPSRAASAAFGIKAGVIAVLCGVLAIALPGIDTTRTLALLVGGLVAGLGLYQWLDPAPRAVWDVRVGGAWLGGGLAMLGIAGAVLFSPVFGHVDAHSRAWASSMPGFAGFILSAAGWMLVRPRD